MAHSRSQGQQLSISGDVGLNGSAAFSWNDDLGLDAELVSSSIGLRPIRTTISASADGLESDPSLATIGQGSRGINGLDGAGIIPSSLALSPEQRTRLDRYLVAVAIAQFDLTHGPVAESVIPSTPDRSQSTKTFDQLNGRNLHRPLPPPTPPGPLTPAECEALALSAFPDRLDTATGEGSVAYTAAIKVDHSSEDYSLPLSPRPNQSHARQRQSVGDVGAAPVRLSDDYYDDLDGENTRSDSGPDSKPIANSSQNSPGSGSYLTNWSSSATSIQHSASEYLSMLHSTSARPSSRSATRTVHSSHASLRASSRTCTPASLIRVDKEDEMDDRYYLFVYYRQRADQTISRGYFQKSLVIVTPARPPAPLVSLWLRVVEVVGELYFDRAQTAKQRQDVLDHFLLSVASWPCPRPGGRVGLKLSLPSLPALGIDAAPSDSLELRLDVSFPLQWEFQYAPEYAVSSTGQAIVATSVPVTPLLKAFGLGGCGAKGLSESLSSLALIGDLWLAWESMLMGDPLLVTAPICARQASEAALHLVSLIRPIPCTSPTRDENGPRFGSGCWPLLPATALAAKARIPNEATPAGALGPGAVVGTTAGHVRAWTSASAKDRKASHLAIFRLGEAHADHPSGLEALRTLGARVPEPSNPKPARPSVSPTRPEPTLNSLPSAQAKARTASKPPKLQLGITTSRTRRVQRDHRIIHLAEAAVRSSKPEEGM